MARFNIHIPDELRERMAQVEDAPGRSWSAVASQAFEDEIAKRRIRKGIAMSQEQQLERLRLERERYADEQSEAGREAGKAWALNESYENLDAVARELGPLIGSNEPQIQASLDAGAITAKLDEALGTDAIKDPSEIWAGFEDLPSDAYAYGWVEGVLEVFDSI